MKIFIVNFFIQNFIEIYVTAFEYSVRFDFGERSLANNASESGYVDTNREIETVQDYSNMQPIPIECIDIFIHPFFVAQSIILLLFTKDAQFADG